MLSSNKPDLPAASPVQLSLYIVEKQIEYDGVEMGVLENGIPYLTERGLARMCGITRTSLAELSANWNLERTKPRGKEIAKILAEHNYKDENLFLNSELNGNPIKAYPEPVCLSLLEYYSFVVSNPRKEAQNAFRTLARTTFRAFIYSATGYSPEQRKIQSWKNFHDRIDMTAMSVPDGYFGIFHEIAYMIVPMIHNGVLISDKVVPDISVGKLWAKYWKENNLDAEYGKPIKYEHNYPSYYPQSKSNPQPAYAYPEPALGHFRKWLRENYIQKNFPKYIISKIKDISIPSKTGQLAINAFSKYIKE